MPTPIKLRDFIRQIRAARTAANERAVIQKECADIRSLFREGSNSWRCRNIAKLLYIHMLGYQAHFGQLECLKLIASPRFTDKRLGYLGSVLLLDERQDVHLLITNSLKNDLKSQTQFVTGMALSALGVICSLEMARDLAGEVEKLLKTSNAYVKKKAALCAFRIIKKDPELIEMFIPATHGLLSEKSHGVLITAVVLITEMCEKSPDTLQHFKIFVSNLIRILKNTILERYPADHDVCVGDSFLQVKILKLLRLLGKNDTDVSERMNDILAQVATNTETSIKGGNAVLHETVLCILDTKSEDSLKALAVNILGRFLFNTERNVKYVALNTLLLTAHSHYNAVQRHRNSIVECLKDSDISIKKRAMELCFVLINAYNIGYMTEELLIFLENADPEIKSQCSFNLFMSAELYAPSRRWLIDTMIKVLNLAGDSVINDVVGNLIQLISESNTLHAYTVKQLWKQLTPDLGNKQPLIQVSAWCIGEFGDLLNCTEDHNGSPLNVSPDDIIETFEKIMMNVTTNLTTKEYATTALMKVSVRFPDVVPRVRRFLDVFATNINTELQQRAIEFSTLVKKYNDLRPSVLERMPAMQSRSSNNHSTVQNGELGDRKLLKNVEVCKENDQDYNILLDLLTDLPETTVTEAAEPEIKSQSYSSDLIALLGSLELDSKIQNINLRERPNTLLDHCKTIPSITAFEKNGLKIIFEFEKPFNSPRVVIINLKAINYSIALIHEFFVQVAVPKGFGLKLLPPTNNVIPANNLGHVQQTLKIVNPTTRQLRIKLRISYTSNGNSVKEEVEVSNIPQEVWI